jgi:hypothetical protein
VPGSSKCHHQIEGGVTNVASWSSTAHASTNPRLRTWLQDGLHKTKVYTDDTIRYGCIASTVREQQILSEALSNINWKNGMYSEYNTLMKNKTCHLVPPQQEGNIIDCKWVYKIKRKVDGSLDR